jgi:hypothetical protein
MLVDWKLNTMKNGPLVAVSFDLHLVHIGANGLFNQRTSWYFRIFTNKTIWPTYNSEEIQGIFHRSQIAHSAVPG